MSLILIRGIPGSGKTTYAREHLPNHLLIEANQYFMVGDNYCFDHAKLMQAHEWCLWKSVQAVKHNIPCVVANTFTRYWEMKEYLRLWPNATILRCTGRFQNTHGIPPSTVATMEARFESIQGEIILDRS